MHWINAYLKARYVAGGRGQGCYDCWGLVREARVNCGQKALSSYGSLRKDDPRGFAKAYQNESKTMVACDPCHGAVAAVMHGAICVHVALVVAGESGQLWLLEINPVRGARFMPLSKWLRDHNTVLFYRDAP